MKTLIIAALLCVPGLLAVASFPVVDSSASECWAMATFQPDGPAFVIQNSTSSQAGRTCAARPYDGRTGVRKTKFHVASRGTYCTGPGIIVYSGVVDLSGVHHGSGTPLNLDIDGPGDFAGYNSIFSNSLGGNGGGSYVGQIDLLASGANVWVYRNSNPSFWSPLTAGLNNIYAGSGSSYLIWGTNPSSNIAVDISNNFWGSGIDPVYSSPSAYWPYYNFSTTSAASSESSNSGISCSDEDDRINMNVKSPKPMGIASDTDTCTTGFPDYVAVLNSNFLYREAYDTMRYWYIPHCYSIAEPEATAGALGGAASGYIKTFDSLLNYRNFIIHCLTLRNDDDWFCSFVAELIGTYADSNNIYIPDYRAQRALNKYLMDNPRCASSASSDEFEYQQLTGTQYQIWVDTSSPGAVFDSTIPTLQQLGLDTVLEINAASDIVYPTQGPTIILDARLEGNPTDADGLLWLSIGREAYLHITVYDLLGRPVPNAGYNGTFEQGTREVPLGVTNAPSGTYYVRIQTANNETQTLKLVKE